MELGSAEGASVTRRAGRSINEGREAQEEFGKGRRLQKGRTCKKDAGAGKMNVPFGLPRAGGKQPREEVGCAGRWPGPSARRGVTGAGCPDAYQVQHRLHDVPVADLPDLDESDENGEFHPDIADRHRRVNHPRGQHYGPGARRSQLPHHRDAAAATSTSSTAGPDGDESRGLRVRPRHRLFARHLLPAVTGTCRRLPTRPGRAAHSPQSHSAGPQGVGPRLRHRPKSRSPAPL